MENKRAERRAHVERLKAKRSKYWGRKPGEMSERLLGMVVQCPANCSCWMCGNPRKYFGELTIQERRQQQEVSHDPKALERDDSQVAS